MSKIAELRLEQMEQSICKKLEDRRVHEGILRMCEDMVDEEPSLRFTILGNIILEHQLKIKENDIEIQFLQKELKSLTVGVEFDASKVVY